MSISIESIKTLFSACGGALVILMTFFEFSKIKINPWSWVASRIGKAINAEVLAEVSSMRADLETLKSDVNKENADLRRIRILGFADEIRRDVRHSEESFNQVLDDITAYERYCLNHPNYENRKATAAISFIIETHRNCMDQNNFL